MSNKLTLAMHFSHASLSKLGRSADDGECPNVWYCLAARVEHKVSSMLWAMYWVYMLGNMPTWLQECSGAVFQSVAAPAVTQRHGAACSLFACASLGIVLERI